jgi:hypothetical protein
VMVSSVVPGTPLVYLPRLSRRPIAGR